MKKILLSALMIGAAAMSANAQANSVLVYGDLRYSATKDAGDNKTRMFNFNPGIGYQFNDYFTLGLTGSFGTTRTRLKTQTEWDFNNTYSAGVFMRGTMRLNRYFVMFNQLEAGYTGGSNGNTGTNTTNSNFNGFYASLTPAIGVIVHDGFALNFGFGGIDFKTVKMSGVVGAKASTSFDLTWGTQFNIGVSKNISCGMHRRHRGHHMMMNHGSRIEKEDMKDDDDAKEEKED